MHVYATSDPNAGNSKCTFLLALSFTDGGSWNDRTHATVPPGASNSEVLTRKYGKSVARVELNSQNASRVERVAAARASPDRINLASAK